MARLAPSRTAGRLSPLLSSLIVGLSWGLWHLPLHLRGMYDGDMGAGLAGIGAADRQQLSARGSLHMAVQPRSRRASRRHPAAHVAEQHLGILAARERRTDSGAARSSRSSWSSRDRMYAARTRVCAAEWRPHDAGITATATGCRREHDDGPGSRRGRRGRPTGPDDEGLDPPGRILTRAASLIRRFPWVASTLARGGTRRRCSPPHLGRMRANCCSSPM